MERDAMELLDRLRVPYERIEHPAVYTCDEAARYDVGTGAADVKNLFLVNADGSAYYLVLLPAAKKLKTRQLARELGEKSLSFASEGDMARLLGVTTGAVSPLCLAGSGAATVTAVLDRELLQCVRFSFHPCVNTASILLSADDFFRVMKQLPNRSVFLEL